MWSDSLDVGMLYGNLGVIAAPRVVPRSPLRRNLRALVCVVVYPRCDCVPSVVLAPVALRGGFGTR